MNFMEFDMRLWLRKAVVSVKSAIVRLFWFDIKTQRNLKLGTEQFKGP